MRANPMPFGQLDANHDGTISPDELRSDTALEDVKYGDIDRNGDGKISPAELEAWQRNHKPARP